MTRRARLLLVCGALAAPTWAGADEPEALHLAAGSVARQQIVALGRDVRVEGEALAGVAALDGTVAHRRHGGGRRHGARRRRGARARGASSTATSSCSAASCDWRRGAADRRVARSPIRRSRAPGSRCSRGRASDSPPPRPWSSAAKLALVAAWLALTLLLFATAGRAVVATAEEVAARAAARVRRRARRGARDAGLTALFLSALLPALVALPLLALVVVAALVAQALGDGRGVPRPRRPPARAR